MAAKQVRFPPPSGCARLRLARAYLAAGGDARGARGATRPTFDPGDADHFSRPPPRRCSAACLLGSAARRLCIFFAYRWLPCDHGPSCTLAPCLLFVAAVRVFTPPFKVCDDVVVPWLVWLSPPHARRG